MVGVRPWKWSGLAVEMSKFPVGVCLAVTVIADTVHSMAAGLHNDITAHYNHLLVQDQFRQEVSYDLEQIPEA